MEAAELRKEVSLKFREYRKDKIDTNDWWSFIEEGRKQHGELFNTALTKVLEIHNVARKRLKSYLESPLFVFKIRKYCNQYFHTDIEPWEVLEVITPKKVLIRKMDSVIKSAPKEFHAGGFSGNFSDNDEQRWECKSNPENYTEVITLTKNGWGGGRFRMSDKPVKFYDYNF